MCCEPNNWYSGVNLVWLIGILITIFTSFGLLIVNNRKHRKTQVAQSKLQNELHENQKELSILKTQGDKAIHISKEKFDREFKTYSYL